MDIDRDEEAKLRSMDFIAGRAAAPDGEEDAFTGEDDGSQFLNDSGEGVQEKENDREGEEVPRSRWISGVCFF